jgi:Lanthionine synthetase C-like protein
MGLCHGTASNIYMILDVYRQTKDPKWRYYVTELFKFSLDTPLLTDPDQFVNYDCTGTYSSFHDTPSSSIAIFSDFLANFDADLSNMWMLGFGDVPQRKTNAQPKFLPIV